MMELQLVLLYLTQLHQPLMEQLVKLEGKSANGVEAPPTPVTATETARTIIQREIFLCHKTKERKKKKNVFAL